MQFLRCGAPASGDSFEETQLLGADRSVRTNPISLSAYIHAPPRTIRRLCLLSARADSSAFVIVLAGALLYSRLVFHPDLPNAAFVGFYRGGVGSIMQGIEMQAR